MATKKEVLVAAGREVTVTNPDKVYFPATGYTKLELVRYYMAVADGALRGVLRRPMALKRYVNGVAQPPFFQKRAPEPRPDWIDTVQLSFPSGRTADEIVVRDAAQLAWIINLGCVDLNPHPVRAEDLDHPDELRVDLDPVPGVPWSQIRDVAVVARAVLADHGLVGWVKTSGSRGIHVYARIAPRWGFPQVRHAALAVAREVERRMPGRATSKWWKEERQGVFLDYNQNAKDRTVASAYSVRPTPDARVSAPLTWDELPSAELGDFTLRTVPERFAKIGDPWSGIDEAVGSLESLLELSAKQLADMGEAPLPPHYAKEAGEPPRVQPSKRRMGEGGTPAAKEKPAAPQPPAKTTRVAAGRAGMDKPVIVVSAAQEKADALAGLDRWKERHAELLPFLEERDFLVDAMRGRSSLWTRVRVNLERVPEEKRPPAEPPDPDFDPYGAR